MSSKVEFKGLEDVVDSIGELAKQAELEQALKTACMLVEASAKKNAPKGDGTLRRSITSRIDNEGNSIVGVVFTPLEYAPYVEYGTGLFAEDGGRTDVPWCYQDEQGNWHSTSGMRPTPYLRPALYENREQILRLLKEGLTND